MNAKSILSITAVADLIAGVAVLLVPVAVWDPFGVGLDDTAIHLARLNGSCAIGLGVILWLARDWTDWRGIRAVAIGAFVAFVLAGVVAAVSTVTAVLGPLGWVNVALDALLAIGLGYLLFVRREP